MQKDIFGAAVLDYFNTNKPNSITVLSEDFEDDEIPVPYLFRTYAEMSEIEQKALQLSFGKTLDVGCGAGSHSLFLQNDKKLEVTALDISEGAIEVCIKRGVHHTICGNFYDQEIKYDTILLLMNGSGIAGTLENLNTFFEKLKSLLNKNGQVLIDSSDLIYLFENENGEYWVDASKGYYGEMTYQMQYKNETSEPFDWLYLDYNTLQRAASLNRFNCELILEGKHYDYLAKLSLN